MTQRFVQHAALTVAQGVTYFGIDVGSSTPAALGCAQAWPPPTKRHIRSPAPAPTPDCTNRRRVIPASDM
jgi:hypothetical protein